MTGATEAQAVDAVTARRRRLWGGTRPVPDGLPAARPPLLPAHGWVRTALLLLLCFTLLRGIAWANFTPQLWGPDEDYHFLYADHLAHQHSLISPDKPLYTREYSATADAIQYNAFGYGRRFVFDGDPKRSLATIAALPESARDPTAIGRGVGVVHPPLYHLFAAAADWLAGDAPLQTRLTWVRYVSALFGVLAVYAAWLLSAQVLRRGWQQLFVAGLVAVQPMVGFLSGVANHDIALIAFFSLATALMLFIVRTPPRLAQGVWLGGAMTCALLVKGSALALLPLAALAYLAQAFTWRPQWRQTIKSSLAAFGLVLLLAGWWYIRARIVYGSSTGAVGGAGGSAPGAGGASIGQLLSWTKDWTKLTYGTYWWHYDFREVASNTVWYYLPALVGSVGILGLLGVAWSERRQLFSRSDPRLRQVILLVASVLVPYLSFLVTDLHRRADGAGFYVNGGRYLLPAYAAAATLFVTGLLYLVQRAARPLVFGAVGLTAVLFSAHVFVHSYLHRYYEYDGLGQLLHRLSFDRPAFVTPFTLGGVAVLGAAAFIAFVVVAARGVRAVPASGTR